MLPATKARWLAHVRAWKASGLSCADYSARASINPRTLAWYNSRFRPELESAEYSPELGISSELDVPIAGFVELLPSSKVSREPIEIRIRALVIRVPSDFDADALVRLLDIVEAKS